MNSNLNFIYNNKFSRNGTLIVPGHIGESPSCHIKQIWETPKEHIFFVVKNNSSLISVKISELTRKLNLNSEDILKIESEKDANKRSIILRNIVVHKNILKKQERETSLLKFFSPELAILRQSEPEKLLEEIQNIFNSGQVSLDCLIHIFETLLKEYQETPYEKFFLFSQKILEKIISDPDKQTSKDWIEKLILDLQSNPETEPLHLHILNLIISTRENLDKLSLNPPQERTETRTQVHSTYLKRIARDEEIYSYLDLDNWQSADNKKEACRRIIDCFRKKNHKLDLSGLNLTTLPELPDFFWVKELDLSKNEIQTLEPLSAFKYLETLDLSYNKMSKIDGIPNFLPLKKLERLQSLKLLYMGGSSNLLMNRIKKDLANCDHIEWTDRFTLAPCSFSRRPGELLIDFLPRRNRALDPLSIFSALTISSSIPSIAETTDPSPSENALSHALEVLQITDLDISSLTSQDSNILPWICRLAGQDKHRGSFLHKMKNYDLFYLTKYVKF